MKKAAVLIILLTLGCGKRDIMDKPVTAADFDSFMERLEEVCGQTDNVTCGYIKGPVLFYLPGADKPGFVPSGDDIYERDRLYKLLNGRNPNEIIEIYKDILLDNLEKSRKRDLDVSRSLDGLYDVYSLTRHYAKDIKVSDISIKFPRRGQTVLAFSIKNASDLTIKQLAGEAEFYTPGDVFLARAKTFVYPFNPPLKPGGLAKIEAEADPTPEKDVSLIKASKNLKIKLSISSLQAKTKDGEDLTVILSLPYSYHKTRELISDQERLYKEAVKKINNINKK